MREKKKLTKNSFTFPLNSPSISERFVCVSWKRKEAMLCEWHKAAKRFNAKFTFATADKRNTKKQ